jgi:predicted transcriptional regulator
MKPTSNEQIDKLERALARAHELREAPDVSHRWIDSVMRDVRRHPSRERSVTDVPRLVWRAAAAIALVSFMFVGSVLTWKVGRTDADFRALFAEASVDATLFTGEP